MKIKISIMIMVALFVSSAANACYCTRPPCNTRGCESDDMLVKGDELFRANNTPKDIPVIDFMVLFAANLAIAKFNCKTVYACVWTTREPTAWEANSRDPHIDCPAVFGADCHIDTIKCGPEVECKE